MREELLCLEIMMVDRKHREKKEESHAVDDEKRTESNRGHVEEADRSRKMIFFLGEGEFPQPFRYASIALGNGISLSGSIRAW
jgi:hypothetical protein